jgi:putative two-component system response regulator
MKIGMDTDIHFLHAVDEGQGRILVVDDDQQTRGVLGRVLEREGYDWVAAASSEEAFDLLKEGPVALMLSDVNMPGGSGLKLIEHARSVYPDTAAVMVTGVDDPETAKAALASGAYGYIIKPFTPNEVRIAVANALRRRELEVENRAHRETLEQIVKARTAALERSAKQLSLTREETVRRLSRAVEYRDEETGLHTERMSRYCALLARRAGLDPESIRMASPLHDVGKVAVSDAVLLKPGKLTASERAEMERHTVVGYEILHGSNSSLLELGATIAWTHHEKFDGTGYPRGLSGEKIPLEGRIAAIADVFDALTTDRSYRQAFPLEEAIAMMRSEPERHFDPHLLDFFLGSMDEVLLIKRQNEELPALQTAKP